MFSQYQKDEALKLYDQIGSVDQTIHILGYPTRRCLYGWIKERSLLNASSDERKSTRRNRAARVAGQVPSPQPAETLSEEQVEQLSYEVHAMQLRLDFLQEVIRRGRSLPHFKLSPLSPKEKTEIIDVLRAKYPLHELLEAADIDRSAYYYHHNAILKQQE